LASAPSDSTLRLRFSVGVTVNDDDVVVEGVCGDVIDGLID
jgi:hypothetical protein